MADIHAGERFVLRRLAPSDLAAFQAYRHDEELGKYQGWTPMTDAEALAFLGRMGSSPLLQPGAWSQIAIAEPNQALVGDIGVFVETDGEHAKIGFTLRRESQGNGIATAAVRAAIDWVFAQTAVERVVGIADDRNLASIRLLERIGMLRTGTHEAMFRGEACREHEYAIARRA